jgi:thiamine-monophosphate kinase
MLIRDLGEFGLIRRMTKEIRTDSSVLKGVGDDCAVIKWTKEKYLLFTTDTIIEGVDFRKQDDPYLIGRKALAISLSDIAACGGMPKYCLISLSIPGKTKVNVCDRIYKGMKYLAGQYGVSIVGGDLSASKILAVNISLIGFVEKKRLVLRNGAKPGDMIFVTGGLGGSISGKHLAFEPRLKEARLLVKGFKINSMIDISDGLIQDLSHILEESKTGAVLYEDLIPVNKQASGLRDAFYSGEDFELLFTLSLKEARKLTGKNSCFIPIGQILSKKSGLTLLTKSGRLKNIQIRGFRHF